MGVAVGIFLGGPKKLSSNLAWIALGFIGGFPVSGLLWPLNGVIGVVCGRVNMG